jgi:hypothetical protein
LGGMRFFARRPEMVPMPMHDPGMRCRFCGGRCWRLGGAGCFGGVRCFRGCGLKQHLQQRNRFAWILARCLARIALRRCGACHRKQNCAGSDDAKGQHDVLRAYCTEAIRHTRRDLKVTRMRIFSRKAGTKSGSIYAGAPAPEGEKSRNGAIRRLCRWS